MGDWGEDPESNSRSYPEPTYNDESADADIVEISVPVRDIGLIIGKAGSRIRELQNEFGVSIQVDRQSGGVAVQGGSESQRRACTTKISNIIDGTDRPQSGYGRSDRQPSYGDGGNATCISVTSQDVGSIIGRGGSKIQEIERTSGARVKVNRDSLQVSISGSQECRDIAIDLIKQACERPDDRRFQGGNDFRSNNYGYDQRQNVRQSDSEGWGGGGQGDNGYRSQSQQYQRQNGDWDSGGQNDYRSRPQQYQRQNMRQDDGWGGSGQSDYRSRPQQYQGRQGGRQQGDYGGGYNYDAQAPQYQGSHSHQNQYQSSTSQQLVESGWDDDEDWGSGGGGNAPSYSNQYVSSGQSQQPYNQPSYTQDNGGQVDDWSSGTFTATYSNQQNSNYRSPQRSSYNDRGSRYQSRNTSSAPPNSYNQRDSYSSRNQQSSSYGNNDSMGGWERSKPAPAVSDYAPIDWDACLKESEEISNKRWAHMPPVIKDFYREDPEVAALMAEEVDEFRKQSNNIIVSNLDSENEDPIPNPVIKFEHAFADYPEIMGEIERNGFVTPSPIQSQAWPLLLSGRDTIAIAQTGTGKTLAFLLPAFIHIEGQVTPREERSGPSVICLCPTRELAQQIYTEVLKYNYHNIKAVCVYGGKGRREQINACQQGVEIVIATPGRLNDLIQNGFINLESVTYLVLDEADRMLDMGFEPDIRKVLLDVRPDRQSVMTSATWPSGVRKMANRYLKNPAQIYVGSLDLNAVHTVRQELRFVAEEDKRSTLFNFLYNEMAPDDKLLVFCGRKSTCSDVASDLSRNDIPCESIHGDREQQDREDALADFKSSEIRILIATDVASRGLDVLDITHVMNYDFPKDMEEYVHRIGRTGRAGRSGVSISFFTRAEWSKAKDLMKILEEADQEIPAELERMAERYSRHQELMSAEREFCESFLDGSSMGGRRGGGGGGGGGGCYNCGGQGHFSRECPEPRRGGGPRGGRGGRGRRF